MNLPHCKGVQTAPRRSDRGLHFCQCDRPNSLGWLGWTNTGSSVLIRQFLSEGNPPKETAVLLLSVFPHRFCTKLYGFPVGRWALPTNVKIGPGQWWAMPTLQK